MSTRRFAWVVGLVASVAVLAGPHQAAGQPGVNVALLPRSQIVGPGQEFDVTIQVTRAGSPFNAFDAVIGWDPTAIQPVTLTPLSQQEGSYFTSACAKRFHVFTAAADYDSITDVLLCAGVSLTGPGEIYRLRFKAIGPSQVTWIRFVRGLQFYNEGLFVNPDSSLDAVVGIDVPTGVDPTPKRAPSLSLTASPNPSRAGMTMAIEVDRAGRQELTISDVLGRRVRTLSTGTFEAGHRLVSWDGRRDSGAKAPPGVYLATLRASGKTLRTRFTLLE
jgi:hypothetical protein